MLRNQRIISTYDISKPGLNHQLNNMNKTFTEETATSGRVSEMRRIKMNEVSVDENI